MIADVSIDLVSVSMVREYSPADVGNPLTAVRPLAEVWGGLLPSPDAGNVLVADCLDSVRSGEMGWHYVRLCCGVIVSGWDVIPVPGLSGLIWSGFVGNCVDDVPAGF